MAKFVRGDEVKIVNGNGVEQVKVVDAEHYHLTYVGQTPKGRWSSKTQRVTRKAFSRMASAAA